MENGSRHPIDELFRNKLNEDQPVSDNSLWEEMEGLMDKRKKKRFLILFLSLLLIGAGGTGYFLMPGKADKPVYVQTTSQVVSTSQNSANSEKVTAGSTQAELNQPGSKALSTSGETSTTASFGIKTSANSSGNLSTTSSINNAAKISSVASRNNSVVNVKKHRTHSSNTVASSARIDGGLGSISQSQSSSAVNSKNGNLSSSDGNQAMVDAKNNKQGITNNGDTTLKASFALNGIPVSTKVAGEDTASKKHDFTQEVLEAKKMRRRASMKWYVEVDGAYMDNLHLIGAPASINANYDNIRGSDEKPLATFNYMFKVGFVRKNLQLNSGLGITNLGERVDYKNHIDSAGKAIIQNGSVFKQNGSYINEYVTLPLQVALLIPVKSVRFQLGVGVAGSVPVRWNSYYLNKQIDGLEDPGSLKMINNLVLNANFTFGVEVPFTRHWTALASFEYYRDLTSVFKSSYEIKQEYLGPGGSLGIRYTFAR